MYIKYEVNIMEQKQVKKAMIREKKKHTEELYAFEKMSDSDYDQESFKSSSSEEGKIWILGSGKLFNFNNSHRRKIKTIQRKFLKLDDCINANYNY